MGDVSQILGGARAAAAAGAGDDALVFRQRGARAEEAAPAAPGGATKKKKMNRELSGLLGKNKEAEEMAPSMVRLRSALPLARARTAGYGDIRTPTI